MTDPVVELQSGHIRGLVEKHEDGFNYYAFKGIPYAEPPIGDLRFEDPIPTKKWAGTLDCKNYGPACAQHDFVLQMFYYDENCLHLNVFTREINVPNTRKAVIVWSHNGNFAMGNGDNMYCGPDYLIRKDIVLVTINYRLGILGFLDLEDPIAPGNQGLKDQIMALHWVQQNIQVFGGDPGNVTFGGHSGGAVSAHFLAISPLTKGLMHKIICQGGIAYNPWTVVKEPKKNAIQICSLLGKNLEDPKEIKNFLRSVDVPELMDACQRFWKQVDHKPFGPGIDDKSPNSVVPFERYVAADRGVHLPCLVGHNNKDGLIFLLVMPKKQFFEMGNQDFKNIVLYNAKEVLDHYNLSPSQVRRLYYKNQAVTENNTAILASYASDVYFHLGLHRFVRRQAELSSAPTYLYIFNFDSSEKISKGMYDETLEGVSLLEELPFLFKMAFCDKFKIKHVEKGTKRYQLMEQMTEMWTNFAKYGRPTIELSELIPVHWKPISNGTLFRYMSIDEDLTMQYTVNVEEKWASAKQIKF